MRTFFEAVRQFGWRKASKILLFYQEKRVKRKHINDWNVSYPGRYIDKFRMLWFLWATHRKVAQNGRLDGHPAWVVVSKIAKRRENNRFSQETTKRAHKIICPLSVNANFRTGRLRLNLNPLNLMRWIDSWPFDRTWKPGWIDSTAGLWISSESSSWRRVARESRSRRRHQIFLYGPGRLRRGQIQCCSIISRDFRRFSRTRFTQWIFCIFNWRRPLGAFD